MSRDKLGPRSVTTSALGALALTLSLASIACQGDPGASSAAERPARSSGSDPVLDRIRALGFPERSIEDQGDHYLVEGDIVFSKADRPGDATAPLLQRWSNRWIGSPETIKICIDSSLPTSGDDNWRPAIAAAAKDWSDGPASSIKLRIVTDNTCNTLIRSDKNEISNGNTVADASFPSTTGLPGFRIRINLDAQSNRVFTSSEKKAIMLHELGHTLGFEHSDIKNCSIAGCGSLVPFTTDGDSLSIMIAAVLPNKVLSTGDLVALISIYPEAMAASSRNPFFNEAFTIGNNNVIRRLEYNGSLPVWHNHGNPFPAGQGFQGQITAFGLSGDRIAIYGLGQDGKVKLFWWNGSQWLPGTIDQAFPDGARFVGQLTAVAPAEGGIRVFGLGSNGNILQMYWNGSGWEWFSHPQSFGGGKKFLATLSATIWQGVIHVFGVGGVPESPPRETSDLPSTVLDLWGDGTNWNYADFANIPGLIPAAQMFRGQIAATTYVNDYPFVFGIGKDGALKQLWWNGSGWSFANLGMQFGTGIRYQGPLSASSKTVNNLELFGLSGGFGAADIANLLWGGAVLDYRLNGGSWQWSKLGNGWQ